MKVFDTLGIIGGTSHKHCQTNETDNAFKSPQRKEHGENPKDQKEEDAESQNCSQTGQVTFGEPAICGQRTKVKSCQSKYTQKNLHIICEENRRKGNAIENRISEKQSPRPRDTHFPQTGRQYHHEYKFGNAQRKYSRHAQR